MQFNILHLRILILTTDIFHEVLENKHIWVQKYVFEKNLSRKCSSSSAH